MIKLCTQTDVLNQHYTKEQSLKMLAEAGFDAADLSLFNMTASTRWMGDRYQEEARLLGDEAARLGIPILQAHAPFSFPFNSCDYEKEILPVIDRGVEIAAIAGAKRIVVHPIHHEAYFGNEEKAFETNMAYYRRFAPVCAKYGVKVCVENMWRTNRLRRCIDHDVCSRPEEFCRYVDTLNAQCGPYFAACLDLGHVALVGEELPRMIRALGSRIEALHIHDNNYHEDSHTLPGHGKLDLSAAFQALGEAGYNGLFTLEADNFIVHQAPALLPAALRYMREVSAYYRDLLEQAKS